MAVSLPDEEDLPNALLLILPSMLYLLTDADLQKAKANKLFKMKDLRPGISNDWAASNPNMPEWVAPILNRCIADTQAHQRNMNLWQNISYGIDKKLFPNKICYRCQSLDSQLMTWQQENKTA